jgi:hypothetical protein
MYLYTGAVVFNHLVRVEHIGADLAPPLDLPAATERSDIFSLRSSSSWRKSFALTIASAFSLLAPCVRSPSTCALNAGGRVHNAHGGLALVDVLPARAAGARHVISRSFSSGAQYSETFSITGKHLDQHKRGLAFCVGIKRRDAHQAVHAVLVFKRAVGFSCPLSRRKIAVAAVVVFVFVQNAHAPAALSRQTCDTSQTACAQNPRHRRRRRPPQSRVCACRGHRRCRPRPGF